MGHALAFDTHAYVKKLEQAGFNEKQAEAQAEALVSIVDENLATKLDIESLRRDMKELETGLRRDMKELETGLKKDIALEIERSKAEIVKWNMGTVFAAVGLFATIMKLLG